MVLDQKNLYGRTVCAEGDHRIRLSLPLTQTAMFDSSLRQSEIG
jgi:hypothetical protein